MVGGGWGRGCRRLMQGRFRRRRRTSRLFCNVSEVGKLRLGGELPLPRPSMTRIECRFAWPSMPIISSLAGLNRTCPNVSHLLTVIDPTLKLTCEIGDMFSCSGILTNPDRDLEWPLSPDFRDPWESRRGLRAESPGVELLRSPYPEKKSAKDMGVVGVATVARSLTLALISALYTLDEVRADRRAWASSTGGPWMIGNEATVGDSLGCILLFLILRLS